MYNNELKTKYIQYATTSIHTSFSLETIFKATEPFEKEFGGDLCTMPKDVLYPLLQSILGMRSVSIIRRIIPLREYVKWCLNVEEYPGARDDILNIQNEFGIDKMRNRMVVNPLQLQRYLDVICEKESVENTDNLYRCFYWLAFAGVKKEDILNVKASDVDFNLLWVNVGDRKYPIYREAIPSLKNCCELTQFSYIHPNYRNIIWRNRIPGDELIRGVRGEIDLNAISVELSRRDKKFRPETQMNISHYRVWLSGVFYRMYERELAGYDIDFLPIAREDSIGKEWKLDKSRNTRESKIRQAARDFEDDYYRWKIAFDL